jgi:hypothetical protein
VEGQVIVSNVALRLEMLKCILGRGFVSNKTYFPELFADQFLMSVSEQLRNEWVGIGDGAIDGIEDEDSVARHLEQTPIPGFGYL